MPRNKTLRPATPAAETEFERRRIGNAILRGDRETVLTLAGDEGAEGVNWAFLLVGAAATLERSLRLRTVMDIKLPTAPSRSPFSTASRAWHVAR